MTKEQITEMLQMCKDECKSCVCTEESICYHKNKDGGVDYENPCLFNEMDEGECLLAESPYMWNVRQIKKNMETLGEIE